MDRRDEHILNGKYLIEAYALDRRNSCVRSISFICPSISNFFPSIPHSVRAELVNGSRTTSKLRERGHIYIYMCASSRNISYFGWLGSNVKRRVPRRVTVQRLMFSRLRASASCVSVDIPQREVHKWRHRTMAHTHAQSPRCAQRVPGSPRDPTDCQDDSLRVALRTEITGDGCGSDGQGSLTLRLFLDPTRSEIHKTAPPPPPKSMHDMRGLPLNSMRNPYLP